MELEMPEIGDIEKGKHLGYKSAGENLYTWLPCFVCGKPRWVPLSQAKKRNYQIRCKSCACSVKNKNHNIGAKNHRWKGGRVATSQGYIRVWISPEDPFHSMATQHNDLLEHRLVMAQHLGRPLRKSEIVHHIDGIKTHNDIDNLYLTTRGKHEHSTLLRYVRKEAEKFRITIKEQQKEIKLLKWRMKELEKMLQYKLEQT